MFKNITLSRDIAIDLGTSTVLASASGKGIVLCEPSVVAIDKGTDRVIKIGKEAQEMMGRTGENVTVLRPLKDGFVNDYNISLMMLQYFIRRASGSTLLPPRVMINIPSETSELAKDAILGAAKEAGARKVFTLPSPIAAALGAGLDIDTHIGNMIVDIGGGITEIAVISMGGMIVSKTAPIGSDDFDEAIVAHLRTRYDMHIGPGQAEKIKQQIGEVYDHQTRRTVTVRGRDLRNTGEVKSVTLCSVEMLEALIEPISRLIDNICAVIEETPAELVGDIIRNGITLTGGGSLLGGIDKLIKKVTEIDTHRADRPESCVVLGLSKKLSQISKYTEE